MRGGGKEGRKEGRGREGERGRKGRREKKKSKRKCKWIMVSPATKI